MPQFLKPQSPLKHKDGAFIYPLTTADQVILEDNNRLNFALEHLVYVDEEHQESAVTSLDADTLGGHPVEDFLRPKAGFIYPLAGSVIPEGFLLCDGAEYGRTEFPELFAAIGTIYGNGDGSTTFNVPNLQTRVPIGAGNGYGLGAVGGEATHTLTVDEMPSHTHKLLGESKSLASGTEYSRFSGTGSVEFSSIVNTGGSQPHNNMQPYTVVNYIIATGKDTGVSVSDIIMGAQAIPLEVQYGGTGATTLKDARQNLGVNVRNLLDNSDFRNPVNQRGNTSYIDSGSKYTIDRWKTWGIVEIMDGYIRYTLQGNTGAQYLYQHFEVGTIIAGKTYTGACKLSDGTICVGSGIARSDGNSTILCTADANTIGIRIWANHADGVDKFALCLEYGITSADIVWAALYEGEYTAETLPEYQPKSYSTELAECQRYYYQTWSDSEIASAGAMMARGVTSGRLSGAQFPTTMRAVPTIKIYNTNGTEDAVKEWVSSKVVTNISAIYQNNKHFLMSSPSSIEVGKTYSFHYSASADL